MQIVFTVRTLDSKVKPMTAHSALETFLEARCSGQWQWNVPRWDNGRLTRLNVDIAEVGIAVQALKDWRVIYDSWAAAADACRKDDYPISVATDGWLDDLTAKDILRHLAERYPGQKLVVRSNYCERVWGFVPNDLQPSK